MRKRLGLPVSPWKKSAWNYRRKSQFREIKSTTKRRGYSRRFINTVAGSYEVEEVIAYKLISNNLRFFVKWQSSDETQFSWESLESLDRCAAFKELIKEKFLSMEKDIYVNICNVKQNLKQRIRAAMQQRKSVVMVSKNTFPSLDISELLISF